MKKTRSNKNDQHGDDQEEDPSNDQQQQHPHQITERHITSSEISAITLPSVSSISNTEALHQGGISGSGGPLYDSVGQITDIEQGRGRSGVSMERPSSVALPTPASHSETAHAQALHDEAMITGAQERSVMTLPSMATTPERVDDEGESLLHRGGSGSGGIYQSFGTMEDVSGASSFVVGGNKGQKTGQNEVVLPKDQDVDEDEDDVGLNVSEITQEQVDDGAPAPTKPPKKSKSVGFAKVAALSPADETEPLQGYQHENKNKPKQSRRESLRASIMATLFGGQMSMHDTDDEAPSVIDEEEESPKDRRRAWSVLRRRQKSVILYGRRLISSEDELDEDEDTSGRGFNISQRSEEQQRSERKARLTERVLERASSAQQRFSITIAECVAAIGAYLGLSILAYSFVFEKWPMVDSLYFGVVTFTTTGYGDLVPSTNAGRIFCTFYALGGCAFLGIFLGVLGDKMIQAEIQTIKRLKTRRQRHVMNYIEQEGASLRTVQSSDGSVRSPLSHHHWHIHIPLIFFIVICPSYISIQEGWLWTNGIYYTVVTMCTIGFGDYAPETTQARALAIVFVPCSVAFLGAVLGRIASAVINKRQGKFRDELMQFDITPDMLESMDSDGDGHATKAEYMKFMLLAMEAVDKELLDALDRQFQRLDLTHSGDLTVEDLKASLEKSLQNVKKKLELSKYKSEVLAKCGSDKTSSESTRFGSIRK